MSSFEYYEFYSIDRELTHQERKEIDNLSSRFSPTSRKAVFSYSYSSFKHDEEKILLKYFDFFLYLSSWGTQRIMYKFPQKLVDSKEMMQYDCFIEDFVTNEVKVYKKSKYVIVDIEILKEEGDFWVEEENNISSDLIGIRENILNGDYRALFIMWLHLKKTEFELDRIDETMEIPKQLIPDNLGALNSSLESLVNLYGIDRDWIKGASNYNSSSKTEVVDYNKLISQLPIKTKNKYLREILSGELNLKIKLKKELDQINGGKTNNKSGKILLGELLESIKKERFNQVNLEKKQAEKARLNRLKELEKNKDIILKEIEYHIARRTGKSYDEALKRILQLRDLAFHKREENEFKEWIEALKRELGRKGAMFKRIENAGL